MWKEALWVLAINNRKWEKPLSWKDFSFKPPSKRRG